MPSNPFPWNPNFRNPPPRPSCFHNPEPIDPDSHGLGFMQTSVRIGNSRDVCQLWVSYLPVEFSSTSVEIFLEEWIYKAVHHPAKASCKRASPKNNPKPYPAQIVGLGAEHDRNAGRITPQPRRDFHPKGIQG